MRNLKKLSLALMLTTLFSISFTSCIDDDVSPVVEAIYQSQADLLAAQAAVQNAEAAFLLAQAAVETATAAELDAITARYTALTVTELMEATAAAELAVEEARIAMLLAQAEFDQDLAQILAAIRAASNIEAGIHAADYATAMGQLATLKGDKLTLLGNIAVNELYMKSVVAGSEMTWETYLAGLERDVLAKEASVIANEAYIVRANAYLDGDVVAMTAALATATAAETAKQAEIQALLDEDTQIDADILAVTGNFDQYITDYETMEGELTTLEGNLTTQEGIVETLTDVTIPGLETTIADYDGTTTTLEGEVADADADVVTANTAVTTAATALGTATTPAPSAGDAAIAPSTSLYDDLYNAQLDVANATADLNDYQTAFDLLTATFTTAATNLATATTTFETGGFAALTSTANSNLITAEGNVVTDTATYTAAQAAFIADPNGSVITDAAFVAGTVDDLGEVGTPAAKTYMRVATWVETTLGSTVYVPASFVAGQYSAAAVATEAGVIVADVVAGSVNEDITNLDEIVIWEQDGTAVDAAGAALTTGATAGADDIIISAAITLTAAQAVDANADQVVYFLEVEDDDTATTNVSTLNAATVALGTEILEADVPFYTEVAGPPVVRTYVADNAGSTTYEVLWNSQKAVSQAMWNEADAAGVLQAVQDIYDVQQELFEDGQTTLATKAATLLAANTAVGTASTGAQGAVNAAVTALGTVTAAPSAGDADIDPSTSLYDDLYNAQLVAADAAAALATHTSTTLAGYEAQLVIEEANLVAANNMISEIEILIVRKTADIAALTAEYEALIATPLYAAQQVRILEIADEVAVLTAEKAVLTAEVGALTITISFEGLASTGAIDSAIIAAQGIIDGAPAYLEIKAAQIALGEVTLANLVAEVAKLNADIADLDAEIAAKEIEAAGYLALLQAALAG